MSASLKAPHLRVVGQAVGELSDADLVEALLRHEPWAAERVWRRHSAPVFGLIGRCLGFRTDTEALTQLVFLKLFAEVDRLQSPHNLSRALYAGAVRVLRRELFRRRLRRLIGRSRPSATLEDVATIADPKVREAVCSFYELLDALPSASRIMLVLGRVEGLTPVEIAEVMDMPLLKVQRRLARDQQRAQSILRLSPALAAYKVVERDAEPNLMPEGA